MKKLYLIALLAIFNISLNACYVVECENDTKIQPINILMCTCQQAINETELVDHALTQHKSENTGLFTCSNSCCGKSFQNMLELLTHIRRINQNRVDNYKDEAVMTCSCGISVRNINLTTHVFETHTHDNGQSFQCTPNCCDKTYNSLHEFTRHLRLNSPFSYLLPPVYFSFNDRNENSDAELRHESGYESDFESDYESDEPAMSDADDDYNSVSDLNFGKIKIAGDKINCTCQKLVKKQDFVSHARKTHSFKRRTKTLYKCLTKNCYRSYKDIANLLKHTIAHNKGQVEKHICNNCNYWTFHKCNHTKHIEDLSKCQWYLNQGN